jgi:predicted nucleotidyltransferase component of viral defense system
MEAIVMNEAVARMLERYDCRSLADHLQALREILQEIALLGLWRSKFFDKAAFYGGTALRILYGLDRFSEDMDFSLLSPITNFDLSAYMAAQQKELAAFGFDVRVEQHNKSAGNRIQSAFLKANTLNQLLVIATSEDIVQAVHRGQVLKIKLEVDTDPPPEFDTHTRYVLQPIPFAVRTYVLPDLFAGKMHAVLCRKWKNRVKGRDWYDLVWYAANHPQLHLTHLEQRMRQSGDWEEKEHLAPEEFRKLLIRSIDALDVNLARKEVEPFIKNPQNLTLWSHEFFYDVASRIQLA